MYGRIYRPISVYPGVPYVILLRAIENLPKRYVIGYVGRTVTGGPLCVQAAYIIECYWMPFDFLFLHIIIVHGLLAHGRDYVG